MECNYAIEVYRPDWATSGPEVDVQDCYGSREEAQEAADELREQGLHVEGPYCIRHSDPWA